MKSIGSWIVIVPVVLAVLAGLFYYFRKSSHPKERGVEIQFLDD
jgi:uncharacterized protein YpmB